MGKKKKKDEEFVVVAAEELTLDALIDKELLSCKRAFENGNNLGALGDVLYYCSKYKKPLPEWATLALFVIYEDSIRRAMPTKKGRNAAWEKQYIQDMKDLVRAETVEDCLDHDIKWDDVYYAAHRILEGTLDGGGEDAIEKAYKRYKQRSKKEPGRYKILKTIRTHDTGIPLTPKRQEMWKEVISLIRKK
jgi:hypothetical protein